MIWHSILNVLAALIRNAFQRGHKCTSLDRCEYTEQWGWECSCGAWDDCFTTELRAIDSFHLHIQHQKVKV